MKTVGEFSARWPEAEKALAVEKEIILTHDGRPVARLSPVQDAPAPGQRHDFEAHQKWQEDLFGKGVVLDWAEKFIDERGD